MWQLLSTARDDRGSLTVLAAVLIVALLAVSCGGACLSSAVIARHRAQAVADLAALAAAEHAAMGYEIACARAEQLAQRMSAGGMDCRIDGLDAVVTVRVSITLGRFGIGVAYAVSRAGPDDRVRTL